MTNHRFTPASSHHDFLQLVLRQYVPCTANVVCKIPSVISFEADCVLPLAMNTAALALFGSGNLGLLMPSIQPRALEDWILIYGGSTSVGVTAIQLAKASGAEIVTIASRHNHDSCKTLGANLVFDY